MSTTLFPSIQPETSDSGVSFPLFKEVQWDFKNNAPVYKNGSPVIVTGKDAVVVWAWKALHTARYRHGIYTWDYGNEVESLIGQPFTEELKQSEAARYVEECLLVCPYISGVSNITAVFSEGVLSVQANLKTIYGEVEVNV
jgi:Protein of unknown function (DUF2634).